MMGSVVFWIQMGLFALLFFGGMLGDSFWTDTLKGVAPLYTTMKENKFAAFMVIFLVGNITQSSLMSTGAFEIWHGKTLVWSSLEHGRLPELQDILDGFKKTGVEFNVRPQ